MNIAVSSRAVHRLALDLISREVRATLGVQNIDHAVACQFLRKAKDARTRLPPLLRAAVRLRDIDLILRIERCFLVEELTHLATSPERVASLNMALSQLDAAMKLLRIIREPGSYNADLYFTLPRNRIYGMPRDEAQQFFISHAMRLRNFVTNCRESMQTKLVRRRIKTIKVAQKLYTELQRKALAPHEVREERALYLVS